MVISELGRFPEAFGSVERGSTADADYNLSLQADTSRQ